MTPDQYNMFNEWIDSLPFKLTEDEWEIYFEEYYQELKKFD